DVQALEGVGPVPLGVLLGQELVDEIGRGRLARDDEEVARYGQLGEAGLGRHPGHDGRAVRYLGRCPVATDDAAHGKGVLRLLEVASEKRWDLDAGGVP